ncbi:hypothetical protein AAVH_40079 [Aphelenchoides avenae]|nr:hypothetical protein AAVH_40079 [Aphelenchus avenae]
MFYTSKPLFGVFLLYAALSMLAIIHEADAKFCCCTSEFGSGHNRYCFKLVHAYDCEDAVNPMCKINDRVGYCANMFGEIACLDQGNPEPIDNPSKDAGQP